MALRTKTRTSLAGRSVLITGAARGIGAELARRAAARGARMALVGLEPELLATVAGELGPEHLWVEADVTDPDALAAAVRDADLAPGSRVWAAGEAVAVQRIRRHLFDDCGVPRAHTSVRGYWKHGRAGDEDDGE
jgi:NAD(P)-dependent dehydrogenase (short-subunit alcohol dehydrogenase family)